MKKAFALALTWIIGGLASANAAIMEVDGALVEVGDTDNLLFSTSIVGARFDDKVRALESFLGYGAGSLSMQEDNFVDGTSETTGHSWTQTFTATDSFVTYDFGENSDSIYYLVSISTDAAHSLYYFENSHELQYAFISLANMFSYPGNLPYDLANNSVGGDEFKLERIHHVATVPEPATIVLFLTGLVFLGLTRRSDFRFEPWNSQRPATAGAA